MHVMANLDSQLANQAKHWAAQITDIRLAFSILKVLLGVAAVLDTLLFETDRILEAELFAYTAALRGVIAGLSLISLLATNSMAVALGVADITRHYQALPSGPVPAQCV